MVQMDTVSGTFFVDGGMRPAIAKSGYKWAILIYIRGNRLVCKKIKNQKTGKPTPIIGAKQYSTEQLAKQFLYGKTMNGTNRVMSKKAKSILKEILQ
jgi:hypothetical protein